MADVASIFRIDQYIHPMKNIVVLIDYTEGCKLALQQALVIGKRTGAKLVALNIQKEGHANADAFDKLKTFTMSSIGFQESVTALVHEGTIFQTISEVISDLNPDLVVFCTHGMRGLAQNLFGGHALKLAQALPYPCLVVQENTKVNEQGFSKILFASSPFADVHLKSFQTAILAKLFDAEVVIYEIEKYLGGTEEAIQENNKAVAEYFDSQQIRYTKVKEEINLRSLGFALQTIKFATEHKMDLMTMMSNVQVDDMLMMKADKEKLVANEGGVPVLCCSHDFKPKHHAL